MAKNTNAYFYSTARISGDGVLGAALALTASYQDLVAGVADGSDVISIVAVNAAASQKTITICDKDDAVISTIFIPASAGNAGGTPAIDIIQNGYLKTSEEGPFGRLLHLPNTTSKLRAKVDSVSGGTVTLHVVVKDYTG